MSIDKREQAAAEMAKLIKSALDEMATPAYMERIRYQAMDRRARFLENLRAGFTEAQALELVKS